MGEEILFVVVCMIQQLEIYVPSIVKAHLPSDSHSVLRYLPKRYKSLYG